MKRFFILLRKVLVTLIFSVPSFFVGLSVLALNFLDFTTGLVVLLASLVLSKKLHFKEDFSWNRFCSLSFKGGTVYHIKGKFLNIYVNLVKVWTVWAVLFLIYINYEVQNSFGKSGLIIFSLVAVIVHGFVMLKKYNGSYAKLRAFLSTVTMLAIVTFVYLYFGSQLIWLPVLMFIALAFMTEGFAEFDLREDIIFVFFFLLCSVAVVSTICQFWYNIGLAMQNAWDYIFSLNSSNLMYILIGLGVITAIMLIRFILLQIDKKRVLAEMAEK